MKTLPRYDKKAAEAELVAAIANYKVAYESDKAQGNDEFAQIALNMAINAAERLTRLRGEIKHE